MSSNHSETKILYALEKANNTFTILKEKYLNLEKENKTLEMILDELTKELEKNQKIINEEELSLQKKEHSQKSCSPQLANAIDRTVKAYSINEKRSNEACANSKANRQFLTNL